MPRSEVGRLLLGIVLIGLLTFAVDVVADVISEATGFRDVRQRAIRAARRQTGIEA